MITRLSSNLVCVVLLLLSAGCARTEPVPAEADDIETAPKRFEHNAADTE